MNLGDIFKMTIGNAIFSILGFIFYFISVIIYGFIITMYHIFDIICNVRILNSSIIDDISTRISVLVGIVMLLMVIFSFIQYVLDPDKITDKEMGAKSIVIKVIAVIIMLGSSNFVFNTLYVIQNEVVDSGVMQRILLPSGYYFDTDNFGSRFSSELFFSFYGINQVFFDENGNIREDIDASDKKKVETCQENIISMETNIIEKHNFLAGGLDCLTEQAEVDGHIYNIIEYNFIFALIVGCFVVYMLFMYIISVGMRAVQLAFLEVIAPAAIIGYLQPKKDNMFNKWYKKYFSTYLDLFIRIAIINLCVFMISVVIDAFNGMAVANGAYLVSLEGAGFLEKGFIKIIMIMAILSFAKKAPDLLKELLPSSDGSGLSYGFSKKDRAGLSMVTAATAGAVGAVATNIAVRGSVAGKGKVGGAKFLAVAGGIARGLPGIGLSTLRGVGTGLVSGNAKETYQKQVQASAKYAQWADDGGTSSVDRVKAKVQGIVGVKTAGQIVETELESLKKYEEIHNALKSAVDNVKEVKKAKELVDAVKNGGQHKDEDLEQFKQRIKKAEDEFKAIKDKAINAAYKGESANSAGLDNDSYNAAMEKVKVYRKELIKIQENNKELFNGCKDISSENSQYADLKYNVEQKVQVSVVQMDYDDKKRAARANDKYNGTNNK